MNRHQAVYFRLYFDKQWNLVIIEMQDFDEGDYIQDRFVTKEKFSSEREASDWIILERAKCEQFLKATEDFQYNMWNKSPKE